jgi:hypothetical protein
MCVHVCMHVCMCVHVCSFECGCRHVSVSVSACGVVWYVHVCVHSNTFAGAVHQLTDGYCLKIKFGRYSRSNDTPLFL